MKKLIISSIIIMSIICSNFCIVYADEIDTENIDLNEISIETSATPKTEVNLNSRYVVVLDKNTNRILYEKNSDKRVPMASTTKIMTSTIALEQGNLNDIVEISKKAAGVGGSCLGVKTGDKITLNDLLYGLMLESGNDTAIAIAEHIGGSVERICRVNE